MAAEKLQTIEINPPAKPAAAIIWLHGLGADGHDFEPIVPELHLPGSLAVRFVFPHAPQRAVSINFGMVMRAWYDIVDVAGTHHANADEIRESSRQLEDLIQAEMENGLPPERIILAGFSQGGTIALHTGLRFEKKLAGIMPLSTYLPDARQAAGAYSRINQDISIFMAHGTYDPMIPIEKALETRDALNFLAYSVQWHAYPMEHMVCDEEIQHIRAWIMSALQAGPPTGASEPAARP